MSIIDLQETTPDNWQAKYQGNYGTYTIKIILEKGKIKDFSCSCPSSYYPCKHIPMLEEAIRERVIASTPLKSRKDQVSIEELMKKITPDELQQFVIRRAKYNPELTNAIFLEFAHKIESSPEINNYSAIIRKGLKGVGFDYEDLYDYEDTCIEIGVLEQWINKARQQCKKGNYDEVLLICKACIEEYAEWLQKQDSDIADYISEDYISGPFTVLTDLVSKGGVDQKELFGYCKHEVIKEKYALAGMQDLFNDLLLQLAPVVDPEEFIRIQDRLLNNIQDKASWEAKEILQRKILFYRSSDQPAKAWEIVTGNLQIDDFREEVVKNKIAEKAYAEAKKLINDRLALKEGFYYDIWKWQGLLLNIAIEEGDLPVVRKLSCEFIKERFKEEYYQIYKSTFGAEEWTSEMEKLIRQYQKQHSWFSHDVAGLLVAEKQQERLMHYVDKHLTVDLMEKYYPHFPSAEQTLTMFRRAIDQYAEKNLGRTHYETIARLIKTMKRLKGGKQIIDEMIARYKVIYKNRRAMMEILNQIG